MLYNIQKDFEAEPIVKNFNILQQVKNKVDRFDVNKNIGANDQALIYTFAKAMDPNSAVKE